MNYDDQRVDEAVLALLAAFASADGRTWKGYDFGVMDRLHERGFIDNPASKKKSVYLSGEGMQRGRQLADQLFGSAPESGTQERGRQE